MSRVLRVVSGGQTGVDRAALDAAIDLGIPYGGWCPAGGWAEDHEHPPGLLVRYPGLRETPGAHPATRTRWNVRDSDATLVLLPTGGTASGGTELTVRCADELSRPHLVATPGETERIRRWLDSQRDGLTLNIAGPRESEVPGSYVAAYDALRFMLSSDAVRTVGGDE